MSDAVYIGRLVSFTSLESLHEKLASLNRDGCYYPIVPLTKKFPAIDVILFCPKRERFIVFQVTVNDDHDDSETKLVS